jgi:outer membrane immunogenic protein
MKALIRFVFLLILTGLLTFNLCAGLEPVSGKEMKQVAPMTPSSCDWSGFYLGVNVGGQFGHSENKDLDDYNFPDRSWGYSESGVTGGEQIGYNWQFGHIVFGPEIDLGYMNLNGRGIEPGVPHDTFGESNSDFYTTFRGRIGIACHCWLVYATAGGIGVNYETKVTDNSFTNAGPDTINASKEEFDWGYTFGGGVERMFNMCGKRWSLKVEYLYFGLDNQSFSATSGNGNGPYGWRAETEGHIVRGGLNFHF